MEEERRLCYVAITRAKKSLTITHAAQRMLYGRTSANKLSRFVEEIPPECLDRPAESPAPRQPFARMPAQPPRRQTVFPQATIAAAPKQEIPDYRAGDSVRHAAFGKGMVLSVIKMGNDALLEIAFDEKGTKRLMARTASAHMQKLNS